jgi:hypothetical protein
MIRFIKSTSLVTDVNSLVNLRRTPCVIIGILITILGLMFIQPIHGQQKPPRPMSVKTYQNLSFGSIIQGNSGGTVIIYPDGTRSSTGNLILPPLGSQGNEAIFEIKAPPGTLITILLSNTALSNGAHSMNVLIGPTDPISPFITTHQQAGTSFIHVGGTLTVGNPLENPAGNYSGTFTVTFIQQ